MSVHPAKGTLRMSWRRASVRFRRPLAAVLAGLAVLVTVSTLRSEPPPAPAMASTPSSAPGEVTVPVPLAVSAGILQPGDVIDLVSVDDDGRARVVAPRARVVGQPASVGGFGSTDPLLLVAVPEAVALALASATARDALTVLIRGNAAASSLDSPA